MIITKTPFRVTLGGGGVDLPAYYVEYGGFVVSASIDKFMYITIEESLDDKTRIIYSKTEVVENINNIEQTAQNNRNNPTSGSIIFYS